MTWRCHLDQALTSSPRVVWRKARHRVRSRLKRDMGWLRARLLSTDLSDADLLQALDRRFPTVQAFLDHMMARKEPRFFLDSNRRHESVAQVRACCPQAEALIVAAADQACDHTFDLLGSGPICLGDSIDWHRDFKTGHQWDPDQYYADIRPAPYPGGYDIKVPWELSRCQHFAWLGQAYWFTEDERYAKEFVAQALDWIVQNPPEFGVNWASAMDVSIRVVNWLWGFHFFRGSPHLTHAFLLSFGKSLLVHGRFIVSNLEQTPWLSTNHYLANLVSLIYLGILLPEFKEARRWCDYGLRGLWAEMFKQSYPDGVGFEASISYHRLAVELFLSAVILCQLNGISVPGEVTERLDRMLEFVLYYTKPDGTIPLIGDSDNGRLHRLKRWSEPEREWIDHRYLLAIGAVLFEREDFGRAAADQWEEAYWLLGKRAATFREQLGHMEPTPPRPGSQAFHDGGLYVMRHNDMYMIIDAGPNGQSGQGGHAHNDTLSFELYAWGQSWIVDPGTYVYTADYEARRMFRTTAYHNVTAVDNTEQNRLDVRLPFALGSDLGLQVKRWRSERAYDFLWCSLQSYHTAQETLSHHRQILLQKTGQPFWLIRDVLSEASQHLVEQYFHLAPSVQVALGDNHLQVSGPGDRGMAIVFVPAVYGELELLEGWQSPSYGKRVRALVVRRTATTEASVDLVAMLRPFASRDVTPGWLDETQDLALDGLQQVRRLTC